MALVYKSDFPLSHEKIEYFAGCIRHSVFPESAISNPLPGVNFFENLHQHSVTTTARGEVYFQYSVESLPSGMEGSTRYDADTNRIVVALSEETYEQLEQEHPRARFTLMHELGHAALHSELLIRLSQIPHNECVLARQSPPTHRIFEDTEWQANNFAAALLIPAQVILESDILARNLLDGALALSEQFSVSFEMGMNRLSTVIKYKTSLERATRLLGKERHHSI